MSGANLGICTTYKDEKGNYQMRVGESGFCVSANLISGESSTWTSNEKAHSVEGLVAGTYYLVEEKAPEGYDVAEPILFTLKSDGTIVDKDGKVLKDNLLIMYDDVLKSEKTGDLPVLSIILIGALSMAICGGSYYCLIVKDGIGAIKSKFNK